MDQIPYKKKYKFFIIIFILLFTLTIISCKKNYKIAQTSSKKENVILIYYNEIDKNFRRNKKFFDFNLQYLTDFIKKISKYKVILSSKIEDKRYNIKLIIIPDIKYIPQDIIDKIYTLNNKGTKIIITSESGTRDKEYNKLKQYSFYKLLKIKKFKKYINTTYSDYSLIYLKKELKTNNYSLNVVQLGYKYYFIVDFKKGKNYKTIYEFKAKKPAIIKKENLIYSSIPLFRYSNLNSNQIKNLIIFLLKQIDIQVNNNINFKIKKKKLPEINKYNSFERGKNIKLFYKNVSITLGPFFPDFYFYTNTVSYISSNGKVIKLKPYKYYHLNFKPIYQYFILNNKIKIKSRNLLITTTTSKGYIRIVKLNTNNTFLSFALRGNLYLYQKFKNSPILWAINKLDINLYLCGVVPAEMPFYFKEEALKAMAVVARTYTLRNLKKHINEGADLCNTIHCQVYYGMDYESEPTNKAVFQTNKEVVKYKGKLADTLYHSTCGGITEDASEVWSNKVNYLSSVSDTKDNIKFKSINQLFTIDKEEFFCKDSPKFNWQEKYSQDELIKFYQNKFRNYNIRYIKDINILKRSKSLHVKILKIETNAGTFYINHSIRLSFPGGLDSTLFNIEKLPDNSFIVIGRGWGHSVGMCQWGANGMAKYRYNYKQIIKHYYKGVKVENY